MKKTKATLPMRYWLYVALCALPLMVLFICSYMLLKNSPVDYQPYTGLLGDTNHLANHFQFQSDVWIGTYKGKLYLLPQCQHSTKMTKYDGWLCLLETDGIKKLSKLGNGSSVQVVGVDDRFLYYWVKGDSADKLYCYNMDSQTETLLYSGGAYWFETTIAAENGSFYIPVVSHDNSEESQFIHVLNGAVATATDEQMTYNNGDLRYYLAVKGPKAIEQVFVSDAFNPEREISFEAAKTRVALPSKQGFIIHNEGNSHLLYHVRSYEEVACLFEIPCMSSVSAVTVVDDYAYLSVKRYQGYNGILLEQYENDDKEGTYRISLTDYTIEKVHDGIYNGFFYFGGDHLFATDEYCNVTILDLQGHVVDTLFLVEGTHAATIVSGEQ